MNKIQKLESQTLNKQTTLEQLRREKVRTVGAWLEAIACFCSSLNRYFGLFPLKRKRKLFIKSYESTAIFFWEC